MATSNYGQEHKGGGGGVFGIIMTMRCPSFGENTRQMRKIFLDTRFGNFDESNINLIEIASLGYKSYNQYHFLKAQEQF